MESGLTDFEVLSSGTCCNHEYFMRTDKPFKKIHIPAIFYLMKHNNRVILFDCAYSSHFHEATKSFPEKIYALITPIQFDEEKSVSKQLKQKWDINPEDVEIIIISHFHADHIGALLEFPKAKYVCSKEGYDKVIQLKNHPWKSLIQMGFISKLLPKDFEKRIFKIIDFSELSNKQSLSSSWKKTFPLCKIDFSLEHGYDLFGDSSILLLPLPGHSPGQMGALVSPVMSTEVGLQKKVYPEVNPEEENSKTSKESVVEPERPKNNVSYFLIADACWDSANFEELILPSEITKFVVQDDWKKYLTTVKSLNLIYKAYTNQASQIMFSENPEDFCRTVEILPSHSVKVMRKYVEPEFPKSVLDIELLQQKLVDFEKRFGYNPKNLPTNVGADGQRLSEKELAHEENVIFFKFFLGSLIAAIAVLLTAIKLTK